MTSVCATCARLLAFVGPLTDDRVTHGICRYDYLKTLVTGDFFTPEEHAELVALESARGMRQITVSVPAAVADAIAAETARASAKTGRRTDFATAGGAILERAMNRQAWETESPTISRSLADLVVAALEPR